MYVRGSAGSSDSRAAPLLLEIRTDELSYSTQHYRPIRVTVLKCHDHHRADLHLRTVERRERPALSSLHAHLHSPRNLRIRIVQHHRSVHAEICHRSPPLLCSYFVTRVRTAPGKKIYPSP